MRTRRESLPRNKDSVQLSKSRYVAGLQCHKLLWWKVHEPLATELQPDKVLEDRFDQARQVGELARAMFPGGVLVERVGSLDDRVAATADAMAGEAPAVFEATFVADGVQIAADILERVTDVDGRRRTAEWRLIEAKSSSSVKEEHIPDAAVQWHVLTKSGVDVGRVDILHLNKEFRRPDERSFAALRTTELLARTEVTAESKELLAGTPAKIAEMAAMLDGPLPEVKIGAHCGEPRECPFVKRCWPGDREHISKLYYVSYKKAAEYMEGGVNTVWEIPPKKKLPPAAQRQLRALKDNRLIVEPTLAAALEPFNVARLGFLDFETVNRAVPPWAGMKPWEQAAAQFSYHESRPDSAAAEGGYTHAEYLAEGSEDCRPELARRMIEATRGAERVVSYSSFEKTRIRDLQVVVPSLAGELKALEEKLIDLLPVVRDHVYHPAFDGSFSIKAVLGPMVPGLDYSDLIIVDGLTASVEIARLLFVAGRIAPEERARVRKDLLNYCQRDTFAMVSLLERLRKLAS